MTPKEKAFDLFNRIMLVNSTTYIGKDGLWETKFAISDEAAKQYALIAAETVYNASESLNNIEYWEQVIKAIKKI